MGRLGGGGRSFHRGIGARPVGGHLAGQSQGEQENHSERALCYRTRSSLLWPRAEQHALDTPDRRVRWLVRQVLPLREGQYRRFFRFLSMRGRQISEVCDADAEAYLALLEAEFPAKASRTKHKQALRAWNGLARPILAGPAGS